MGSYIGTDTELKSMQIYIFKMDFKSRNKGLPLQFHTSRLADPE